ncbi:MAG: tRNA uridine-5-carboxymethylaminomethyl(34) synthesis GTPase MnmE [Acidobacteria bacterium RIFCSPLOWO2_12_FULL_66_21]|nr:MAG: tRNA uridine-5-carboxymethylaminomethyl(34) synthesis GTPase MnmE [Acidobacteria bacterium RIFCSPLOWO2_12_FULL_66_21]
MFSPDDTIVAVATPHGRGGIGVVRVSGPAARAVTRAVCDGGGDLEARHATLTAVRTGAGVVDRAVVTFFPAPHSYTGEDVLEISAHGSPVLLRSIVEAAMAAGARLAEPGEFTLRAYLGGRIDLVQAEAVRDLVEAVTPLQARAAFDQLEGTLTTRIRETDGMLFELSARLEASLDFAEEGYHFVGADRAAGEIDAIVGRLDDLLRDRARGRLVREGAHVAIVGRPNAGKSSLFNRLAGAGRAIVTDIAGTTRDLLTELVDIEGLAVTLVDTAGLRETAGDIVEAEGMARAHAARGVADATIVVLDLSTDLTSDDRDVLKATSGSTRLIVGTKADLEPSPAAPWGMEPLRVSSATGAGIDRLRGAIAGILCGAEPSRDTPAMTNVRQADLVSRARDALARAAAAARAGTPEEFVAADVAEARGLLEEVTGARTPDDVLRAIFASFCIGK